MSDHHEGGIAGEVASTTGKIVEAISNPVLIFLIVLVAIVVGGVVYMWHAQRVEALQAYVHLVDTCLPNKDKN